MAERIRYDFYILRYVPDVVKGEFINIGVLLTKDDGQTFAGLLPTSDWTRVQRMAPDADINFLKSWCQGLAEDLHREAEQSTPHHTTLTQRLVDSLSNVVDITLERKALLGDPDCRRQIRELAAEYLD